MTNLTDEDFKKTPKLTWLAETEQSPAVPVQCVFYDNIISKAILGKDDDFKAYINPHTRVSVTDCMNSHRKKKSSNDNCFPSAVEQTDAW